MSKPFRSDKRRKEVLRLKKQEEKRQRRFGAKQPDQDETAGVEGVDETAGVEGVGVEAVEMNATKAE